MAQVETHEITVLHKGIHCAGCETRIQSELARVQGVREVKADHKTQIIRLVLEPENLSIQQIKDQLDDLGFTTE